MNLSSYIEAEFCVKHINNVLYRHYEADWKFVHVCRPHCALYYVTNGVLGIRMDGSEYRVYPDSIVCLNSGTTVEVFCCEVGTEGTLDSYMLSFFSDVSLAAVGLPLILPESSAYLHRFAEAYECWYAQSVAYRIRTRACLEMILASLISDQAATEGLLSNGGKMEKLLVYIHTHYKESLSMEDLRRIVNYSPSHIRRIFCEELGMPPLKYINQVRIRRACELLLDDSTPVCRIAEAVGFDNAPYFSRIFREVMHMTPGEYRRWANMHTNHTL